MYVCNSYTTGMSALPDIYARARGQVRTGKAQVPVVRITNMFNFSMQIYLIGKIFTCYALLL